LNLDLLESNERVEIEAHLNNCAQCRAAYERLSRETAALGGLELDLPDKIYPLVRVNPSRNLMWLKAAAILMIGFLAGFAASSYSQPDCVNVVPFTAHMQRPVVQTGAVSCESEALQVVIR
jgi:hypothetical protein